MLIKTCHVTGFTLLKNNPSMRQQLLKSYVNGEVNLFNPLNPHDALKHHFTSLKTDLIFQQPRLLKQKFPENWFANT